MSDLSSITINSVEDGIVIESNDNTIINNIITESLLGDGVRIDGARNIVKGNAIIDSRQRVVGGSGISITRISDDTQVLDNTIISSEKTGITVQGGKRIVIQVKASLSRTIVLQTAMLALQSMERTQL